MENRGKVTVAVIKDDELGGRGPGGADDLRKTRLEEFAPGCRADDHAAGHGHIVVQEKDIDAGLRQDECAVHDRCGKLIEQVVRQVRAEAQILHEHLKAAQPVGRLEELTPEVRRPARDCQAASVKRGNPVRQAGMPLRRKQVRQYEISEIAESRGGREGTARPALRVIIPLMVGAQLMHVADMHVGRQPPHVGKKVILGRKRLEVDEAHVQPQPFRGIRDPLDFLIPERQRLGRTIGTPASQRSTYTFTRVHDLLPSCARSDRP